jgi:hypothetical protein
MASMRRNGRAPQPAPKRLPPRAGFLIAGAILAIVVVIFIGLNVSYMKTENAQKGGDVSLRERPRGPEGLARTPVSKSR